MASSDSQIDKPQCWRPKRAVLPDVNINAGTQSINTERASLTVPRVSNLVFGNVIKCSSSCLMH